MKTPQPRLDDLLPSRLEADLEAGMQSLFRRQPMLCGFSLREAASDTADWHVGGLFITEVSVYPARSLGVPAALCGEIAKTLVDLLDECPEAYTLLRERTFARVFH